MDTPVNRLFAELLLVAYLSVGSDRSPNVFQHVHMYHADHRKSMDTKDNDYEPQVELAILADALPQPD